MKAPQAVAIATLSVLMLFAAGASFADASESTARIEALQARFDEQRAEIRAMDARAAEVEGEDLVALEGASLDRRIESIETLGELVEAVVAYEAEGGDASAERARLTERLGRLVKRLDEVLAEAETASSAIEAERGAAAPADRLEIEQRLTRQSELTGRMLAATAEVVSMMEALGLDASALRASLGERLSDRALVFAGRLDLMSEKLADAESRGAQSPDDAAIKAEIQAISARIEGDTDQLAKQIPLMDQLELATSDYKRLLISSTGQITTDVFDAEVAQGLLAGWSEQVKQSLIENGPGFLFRTLLFVAVIGAFWLFSRFVRKVVARAVEAPHLRFSQLLKRMIVSMASGSVLVLGVLLALSQLGVEVAPLLAGLGIAGFIVGFALQETLGNFAAGGMILIYRPFDVGDLIECAGGVFGQVSHMNLVSTTILTVDNRTRIVPNGKIWGDVITNLTTQSRRRVDLLFGISYSDDIEKAEGILQDIVKTHPKVLDEPEPVIKLHELGDSSVNFVVRPWATPDDYWEVYWDVTREVKMRFDREGVSIPFPQRDVHFHPAPTEGASS